MDTPQNSLMTKIKLPGRIFQLPSRAALYTHGEVSGEEGEVHVHAMSALAEIDLKNPDLLFNGNALTRVFQECIPQIKKPTELYGRDIDALMFFLRLVTYGPNFEIRVKHNCEEAKEHSYVVDIERLIQEIKFLDPTEIEEKFTVVVGDAENQQIVKVHPVKFAHMIKLYQMNMGKTEFSPADVKKNVVFNLVSLIQSVDGIEDKKQIEEWVSAITTPMQNRITEAIEKTNEWGPTSTVTLTCKDCQHEMPTDLPLNPISFFTE